MGLMLGSSEAEVLLPRRYVPAGTSLGETLDVFVYTDSEDRPIATTETPLAMDGEFAALEVVSVGKIGVFLDWGLPKDLLLPFRSQLHELQRGDRVVVRVLCDRASGRPVANGQVERFLDAPPRSLREGERVDLLFYEETDLGTKAIVNGAFAGLLYHEPTGGREVSIGGATRGYVQRVRPDGKVDLSLTPSGRAALDDARATLLEALRANGGRLDLGDRSDPEEIRRRLGLSKKVFKRAAGGLYRERRVRIGPDSIVALDAEDLSP